MAASAGEDWDSFIDRMCSLETRNAELLQKVQQLEAENAELEDLRRWRDAKKELPPRKEGYSWSEPVQALMPRILGNIEIRTLSFDYSPIAENGGIWFHAIGNNWTPMHVNPISWRPLDLPEEHQ